MTYKVINEIFETATITPEIVYTYTNITRDRLFINKFDLLPDIYFATQGEIIIEKNGVEVYKNVTGDKNKLGTYAQFPIRGVIPFLDRDDTLIIKMFDREHATPEPEKIKLGISIELDYTDSPIPSVLIPFAIAQLAQISKKIILFPQMDYIESSSKKYYKNFDATGYKNLSITINATNRASPTLESNSHTQPDISLFLQDLESGYWGNKTISSKIGTFNPDYKIDSGLRFNQTRSEDKFYNSDNEEISILGDTGTYESDITVFDMNNENKIDRAYEFELLAASNFALDAAFTRIDTIWRTYTESKTRERNPGTTTQYRYTTNQNLNYRYTLKGKRIFATITKSLKIQGSDTFDFDIVSDIRVVDDLPDTKHDYTFNTTFKYVRFVVSVDYVIEVEDTSSIENIEWLRVSSFIFNSNGQPAEYITPQQIGLSTIFNDLPNFGTEFLPNRNMPFYNLDFPEYVPTALRSFLGITRSIENSQEPLNFSKSIRVDNTPIILTMGLESKGVDNEWFSLIDDLGDISTQGKTILEVKEFNLESSVILPRGQSTLRAFIDITGSVRLAALVTLS